MHRKVEQYRFLDAHLRLPNEFAFHALALDEQRKPFEPTFWTRTVENANPGGGAKPRPLDQVEQRWFVGAHANVGGGYPSDILAQAPLKWLMDKAASKGLAFRSGFAMDPFDPTPDVRDSYAEFRNPLVRAFSKRFYRSVGGAPPKVGTAATTERINEAMTAQLTSFCPSSKFLNRQSWRVFVGAARSVRSRAHSGGSRIA